MILIAGPCVIESRDVILRIAQRLKNMVEGLGGEVDFYFKSSFDKANRTSLASFRGPGLDEGLKILAEIKREFGLQILSDIHESGQAAPAAEVCDVLQIPAFLCRQTDLLIAAAATPAKINIKKGQFLAPADIRFSVEKILQTRQGAAAQNIFEKNISNPSYAAAAAAGVFVAERGTSLGYHNLVVDLRSLVIMRDFAPVIFDATHSVQLPGGAGGSSGGQREFIAPLARAAAAVGVDGFFFETHSDPAAALCDGPNMLSLEELQTCLTSLLRIQEARG